MSHIDSRVKFSSKAEADFLALCANQRKLVAVLLVELANDHECGVPHVDNPEDRSSDFGAETAKIRSKWGVTFFYGISEGKIELDGIAVELPPPPPDGTSPFSATTLVQLLNSTLVDCETTPIFLKPQAPPVPDPCIITAFDDAWAASCKSAAQPWLDGRRVKDLARLVTPPSWPVDIDVYRDSGNARPLMGVPRFVETGLSGVDTLLGVGASVLLTKAALPNAFTRMGAEAAFMSGSVDTKTVSIFVDADDPSIFSGWCGQGFDRMSNHRFDANRPILSEGDEVQSFELTSLGIDGGVPGDIGGFSRRLPTPQCSPPLC